MRRGLVIGRFQPFHLGHLHLVENVLEECHEFIKCLVKTAVDIQTPIFERKRTYNGTKIRNLISRELPWRHLVPSSVAILIEKMDGINRIRSLRNVNYRDKPKIYPNVK